jgi:ribosomal protein S18 acetylase RimI-like enzyme
VLRACEPADTRALVALAEGTGVFKPLEIATLEQVLLDYHAEERGNGHRCTTLLHERAVAGFVYWAPAEMTDRSWHLWWIAVRRDVHARGLGAALLAHCEAEVARAGGRLLLIETSSLPVYAATLRFYARHGYGTPSRIPDFYADGDDLLVFRKRLEEST